jgi:hypothetical protein
MFNDHRYSLQSGKLWLNQNLRQVVPVEVKVVIIIIKPQDFDFSKIKSGQDVFENIGDGRFVPNGRDIFKFGITVFVM